MHDAWWQYYALYGIITVSPLVLFLYKRCPYSMLIRSVFELRKLKTSFSAELGDWISSSLLLVSSTHFYCIVLWSSQQGFIGWFIESKHILKHMLTILGLIWASQIIGIHKRNPRGVQLQWALQLPSRLRIERKIERYIRLLTGRKHVARHLPHYLWEATTCDAPQYIQTGDNTCWGKC